MKQTTLKSRRLLKSCYLHAISLKFYFYSATLKKKVTKKFKMINKNYSELCTNNITHQLQRSAMDE